MVLRHTWGAKQTNYRKTIGLYHSHCVYKLCQYPNFNVFEFSPLQTIKSLQKIITGKTANLKTLVKDSLKFIH